MSNKDKEVVRSLYFAYGSNLNIMQIMKRCPSVQFHSLATLKNYKLIFDRVASIEKSENSLVIGVIYSLTEKDIDSLDKYEGVSSNTYHKIHFNLNGFQVFTYIKTDTSANQLPSLDYVNKIKNGRHFWGYSIKDLTSLKTITIEKIIETKKAERTYTYSKGSRIERTSPKDNWKIDSSSINNDSRYDSHFLSKKEFIERYLRKNNLKSNDLYFHLDLIDRDYRDYLRRNTDLYI